ncbi:MAG: YqaE/Pmp3 family membrane protein [Proteobacteria bacterium]|nr:YqaE/Pmp3 family membrane protein [Pseudomonadota bacterium]
MNSVILIVLAIILPPLAVFLQKGAGKDLVINIVLCLFFYIPGIFHALWVVLK